VPQSYLAVDLYMTSSLLDETVNLAQPEAGASAVALRRKERVECPVGDFGRHSCSRIANRDHDVLARGNVEMRRGTIVVEPGVKRLYCQSAAFRHGVAGVHREIENGVFELTRIDTGSPKPTCRMRASAASRISISLLSRALGLFQLSCAVRNARLELLVKQQHFLGCQHGLRRGAAQGMDPHGYCTADNQKKRQSDPVEGRADRKGVDWLD
jgi:hypothetical protein